MADGQGGASAGVRKGRCIGGATARVEKIGRRSPRATVRDFYPLILLSRQLVLLPSLRRHSVGGGGRWRVSSGRRPRPAPRPGGLWARR